MDDNKRRPACFLRHMRAVKFVFQDFPRRLGSGQCILIIKGFRFLIPSVLSISPGARVMFCLPVLGNINKLTEGFKGALLDLSPSPFSLSFTPSFFPSLPPWHFINLNPMVESLYFSRFHLQITQSSTKSLSPLPRLPLISRLISVSDS